MGKSWTAPKSRKWRKRATYPSNLHQIGYHDDAGGLFLPHHPPEIIHRLMNRTYSERHNQPSPRLVLRNNCTLFVTLRTTASMKRVHLNTYYTFSQYLTLGGNVVAWSLVTLKTQHECQLAEKMFEMLSTKLLMICSNGHYPTFVCNSVIFWK